ncbi:MAG: hypothetical protein L3J52_06550 [Proteobacteria bacterium]|nr:hypothetical protein [Pseudomonadota bacterium]
MLNKKSFSRKQGGFFLGLLFTIIYGVVSAQQNVTTQEQELTFDHDKSFVVRGNQNILSLSGGDTVEIGDTLNAGDIAYGRADLTGIEESIIVVDVGSTISSDPAPFPPGNPGNLILITPADPNNTFIMIVGGGAISMNIVTEGVVRRYACGGIFIDCSQFVLDPVNRMVTFTNATVENVDTQSVLTINGILTWLEDSVFVNGFETGI